MAVEQLPASFVPLMASRSQLSYELLSILPIGCAIIEADGQCSYLNPTGQRILGCPAFAFSQIIFSQVRADYPVHTYLYPVNRLPFMQALQGCPSQAEDIVFSNQGLEVFLGMQALPVWDPQESAYRAIATFQDLSAQFRATTELREQHYVYRRLAENIPGSFQYTLPPDGLGYLSYVSPSFYEHYGVDPDWLLADPDHLWHIVSPETVDAMRAEVVRSYQTFTPWVHEGIFITPRGRQWFQGYAVPERFANGNVVWHGFVSDITAQKRLELEIEERRRAQVLAYKTELALRSANAELERLASLDGLTQIANRRRFDEYLERTWQMMLWGQQGMVVVLCDVDYFKGYNDHYGHLMGDVCLRQIARAIQETVGRVGNLVARYGGEEFAIVLTNTDTAGALQVVHRIQEAIAQLAIPHEASEVSDWVTLSFGVAAIVPRFGSLSDSLLAHADKALYGAKKQGRNRIVCH